MNLLTYHLDVAFMQTFHVPHNGILAMHLNGVKGVWHLPEKNRSKVIYTHCWIQAGWRQGRKMVLRPLPTFSLCCKWYYVNYLNYLAVKGSALCAILAKSFKQIYNWYCGGYPNRNLSCGVECWVWFSCCQYAVSGWDSKSYLLFHHGSMLKLYKSVPEIHVAYCNPKTNTSVPYFQEELKVLHCMSNWSDQTAVQDHHRFLSDVGICLHTAQVCAGTSECISSKQKLIRLLSTFFSGSFSHVYSNSWQLLCLSMTKYTKLGCYSSCYSKLL